MERWKTFQAIFLTRWKVIIGGSITLLGIYDLFVAQFLNQTLQDKMPIFADFISRLGWPWWLWIIIFLSLTVIFIFESAHKLRFELEARLDFVKLGSLRTEGVALRNKGMSLIDKNSLSNWIQDFHNWHGKVLNAIQKSSPDKAEWFKTLDRFQAPNYPNALDQEHVRFLRIFDEKLRRLDIIIRENIGLPKD